MFGHPGFSALEFAGGEQLSTRKTLSLKGKLAASSTGYDERSPPPTGNTELPEPHSPHDLNAHKRRRGTFLNHTPRIFEMRPSKQSDQHTSVDESSRLNDSPQTRSTGSKTTSWSQPWRQTPPKLWDIEHAIGIDPEGPHELDSKELVLAPNDEASMLNKDSMTSNGSLGMCLTLEHGYTPTKPTSSEVGVSDSVEPEKQGKRRRRQTPYKMPVLKPSITSRHSPLEPLVMHHRRQASQATSSSVGDIAPQVDIDDIAEVSTFRALQEYFDSQALVERKAPSDHTRRSPQPQDVPLPSSPITPLPKLLLGLTTSFPAEEGDVLVDEAPDLPERSPKRLGNVSCMHIRSTSAASNSDFLSAANGIYSPYDKKHDILVVQKKRDQGQERESSAARTASSTLHRMAPPIPGHEALTATAKLNDLNFYLRNTGPSPEPIGGQRKKTGFRMFKVGGKKTLAARVGSVEGSPRTYKTRPPMPACAREMTTSGGTKHYRIVIPSDNIVQDQTITLPVNEISMGKIRRSKHVSITFTDEMLDPLGSPAIEQAISDFNAEGSPSTRKGSKVKVTRSPRASPRAPKLMAVDGHDHPLATREEQTRARKLRDLKKMKQQRQSETTDEEASAGASFTLSQGNSSVRRSGSLLLSVDEAEDLESSAQEVGLLKQRVIVLQRQNTDLAEALARIVGFEAEDGDLDADAVLKACRQCRTESGSSDGHGRRGRVFTA